MFIVSSMSIASVGAYVGLTEFITNLFVPMLAELSPTAILGGTFIGGILANILMTPGAMLPTLCAPFAQHCRRRWNQSNGLDYDIDFNM